MKTSFRSIVWLPYVVALILFTTLNLIYFAPQFRGESLPQNDVRQYSGMTQDILQHRQQYGEDPQWTGNMFGGMPAYLINVKYEGTWVKSLSKAFYFLGQPAALIFIAMVCFFLMTLCLGINPWVGIIPSLAYGFSTYFFIIIGAGHITKMMALAFAPMLFGGVWYAYYRNMWIGAALTAFFGSIQIGVNHPQITYYFLIALGFFWVYELIRSVRERILLRFTKVTALLLLAGALAVGSNAGMLWYINQHSPETMRGGTELTRGETTNTAKARLDLDYATAWSYGPGETFNLMIPNLYGGSSHGGFSPDGEVAQALTKYNARNMVTQLPGYWGPQPFTSGPVYMGAVALFLAALGMFLLHDKSKWWLAAITLLAVFLSWGKHMLWFTELFYNYFPIYGKFRTVSMILVIAEWCVPVLMALTLQQMWTMRTTDGLLGTDNKVRFTKSLKYSTYIVGGIALFFLFFGGTVLSFSGANDAQLPTDIQAAMRQERAGMMRADAFRALLFVLLAAGAVWLYGSGKIRNWLFLLLMGGLVTADMVPVNLRYLNHEMFTPVNHNIPQATEADKVILQDKELGFRVMNLTVSPFNDATTSYFHRSVGGYHGAKLQRYQDLIDRYLGQMDMNILNMLNTKYFIVPDQETNAPLVQMNPDANGPAWFVSQVEIVEGADEEIQRLGQIDTKTEAVIDRQFAGALEGITPGADSAAVIRMTDYRANRQQYEYTAQAPGVAVFSEIYYPKGWTAYLDGAEVPHFRANYLLRAMVLPAGTHTVEFRFRAPNYGPLTTVTLICSLLILAGGVAAAGYSIYNRRRKKSEDRNPDFVTNCK